MTASTLWSGIAIITSRQSCRTWSVRISFWFGFMGFSGRAVPLDVVVVQDDDPIVVRRCHFPDLGAGVCRGRRSSEQWTFTRAPDKGRNFPVGSYETALASHCFASSPGCAAVDARPAA